MEIIKRTGIFITIEGLDGSGKSTQAGYMKTYLESKGCDVVLTREPGGTYISEKIRDVILDKGNLGMEPMAEALLYAASRAQHVAEKIRPALLEGKIVICDRFTDSSIAYQGYGRGLGKCVSEINRYAMMGCEPDITFLMKLDPEAGRQRIDSNKFDRLEAEKLEFHKEVYRGYLELEKTYSERIIGFDATKSIEEIRHAIFRQLDRVLYLKNNCGINCKNNR